MLQTQAQGLQRLVFLDSTSAPYGYSEYLPVGYDTSATQTWPLVLFLHGLGEQGNGNSNLNKVTIHGPSRNIKNGTHYPAVVVSPQSPVWWNRDVINRFVDSMQSFYRIDTNRIYVTGLSMGGGGTWKYGAKYADRIAAMVPICGAADPATGDGDALKEMPIWAFHNSGDAVVTVNRTYRWRDSIIAAGGNPLITIYNKNGHNAWTQTYDDPNMWNWLFAQARVVNGIELGTPELSLQPIPANTVSSGTISVSAEDLNGSIDSVWLDLSSIGLGAKILLNHSSGNLYQQNLSFPSGLTLGFHPATIVAKDNEGNTKSHTFNLLIVSQLLPTGGVYYTLGINFNNGQNASGWNNTDANPNIDRSYPNLFETAGTPTSIGMRMIGRWDGANSSGMNTGTNSGPVPDIVMGTCWYVNTYSPTLRLNNLDPSYAYNLIFMGSRDGGGNRTTHYRAGGQTVSLDAAYNSSNTVRIDNLSPNADGEIDIEIWKDAAASYGYLNALTIEVASSASVFPVEWLDFDIIPKNNSISLEWSTQEELNNHYFQIERSADGQLYKPIAQVQPNQAMEYRYQDRYPLVGFNQYRIKQVDIDGQFSYSPVRVVNFRPAEERLNFSAYPNPWQGDLFIERLDESGSVWELYLYDIRGSLIYSQKGIEQKSLLITDLAHLAPGLYHLQLISGQKRKSTSLLKLND